MAGAEIKVYHVLLTSDKEVLADDKDKIQEKEIAKLKLLNFTAYNELIIAQEDKVCFQIIEEAQTKANKYIDSRISWTTLSKKLNQP